MVVGWDSVVGCCARRQMELRMCAVGSPEPAVARHVGASAVDYSTGDAIDDFVRHSSDIAIARREAVDWRHIGAVTEMVEKRLSCFSVAVALMQLLLLLVVAVVGGLL